MNNQKKLDPTTIFIVLLVIVVIALLGFLGNFAVQKNLISLPQISLFNKSKVTLNTEALNLTPPVKILYSAKITDKTNNSLTVDITPVSPPTDTSTKIISLKIGTTDKTVIEIQKPFIPYSFKKIDSSVSAERTLNLDGFAVGDLVDITLTTDLRTTNTNNLVAEKISKIPDQNLLIGKVKTATESSLIVTGLTRPVNDATSNKNTTAQTEEDYTVNINEDTEISTNDQSGVRKLALPDLPIGNYVTVYTDSPITGTSLTAALISVYSI